MITIYLNESIDEPERRESVYGGDFHLITDIRRRSRSSSLPES